MENLLERAKNHETVTEGRKILSDVFMAIKEGRISNSDANKINRIVDKKIKQANKDLDKKGSSKYLD